jgi:4-diphosphocytidyl-2-C-methyl-D-erythritol kinase
VSGSGPTCLFLAIDEADADRVRDAVGQAGVTALVAAGPVPGAHVVESL